MKNEVYINVIVDYRTGRLINADKLVKEIEELKRELENIKVQLSCKEINQ